MRAIQMTEHGGPEVLVPTQLPAPEPAPDQVVVRVEAAGVNFIDTYQRSGLYAVGLPYVPGMEAAGVVERVGEEVTEAAVGDRVAFAGAPGSYAELVAVPAAKVVPVPDSVDSRTAAALMLQGMTAHYLAYSTYRLAQGSTAVVLAAAGGVGRLLVQLAKHVGATVLAATSTEDKAALARAAGADEVIRYREVDLVEAVRAATDGQGADVVYDSVGADTWESSMDCLRLRGMLVLYGNASGPVPPIDPLELNRRGSLYLTRPQLAHYIADRAELTWRAAELFELAGSGELEVRLDRTWGLAEAADAHRYLEDGRTTGKLLLVP